MSFMINPFERSVINDYFLEHGYQSQGYFQARVGLQITGKYANIYANADVNTYANSDTYANADVNTYANSDPNADVGTYADANACAYAYAYAGTYAYATLDAHAHADAYREGES